MTDFDPFERRLAAAVRSDADASVGRFNARQVADAAVAGTQPGPTHLSRESTRRGGRFGRGRGVTLLAAAAALILVGGALAVGSGVFRRSSVVPPAPSLGPLAIASVEATSPSPSDYLSPSPTTLSLGLTWKRVPLDEQSPRLAWVGDRFVLADVATGSVRTSTDGADWQAVPSDAARAYVAMLQGDLASWQDQTVGWRNLQDPDSSTFQPDGGPPPVTPRDVVTIVRPPAAPIALTPFKGHVESIGIGSKGIVAEVHSDLDWDGWVTKKLGLRTNNDWTTHVKSVTFQNGILDIKLNNRPGLKVVWADQGFEPGDYQDRGFGWYSPDGVSWTEMAPNPNPTEAFGSTLPTGGYGQVTGVSNGFFATGASEGPCTNPDGCPGMWFSPDGLSWSFLATTPSLPGNLLPWNGGMLATDGVQRFDLWTSDGTSELPMAAKLRSSKNQAGGDVETGPLGLVSIGNGQALVSRDGSDYQVSSIPASMIAAESGRRGSESLVVGDRSVLVLKWTTVDVEFRGLPSLWLGTFAP